MTELMFLARSKLFMMYMHCEDGALAEFFLTELVAGFTCNGKL